MDQWFAQKLLFVNWSDQILRDGSEAQGDGVAVFLGNGFKTILCVLRIARVPAVLVRVGSRLRRQDLGYVLEVAQPVVPGSERIAVPDSPALTTKSNVAKGKA